MFDSTVKKVPEWMPGADFKREAARCRGLLNRMMSEPYKMVVEQMVYKFYTFSSIIKINITYSLVERYSPSVPCFAIPRKQIHGVGGGRKGATYVDCRRHVCSRNPYSKFFFLRLPLHVHLRTNSANVF